MATTYFVERNSVVREIWGKSDTILFIFAGGAAEFALNKAVDWLYFTGRLPADPLNRLFSTVTYARAIVFSEYDAALRAIDAMNAIHGKIEEERGRRIPDWAYRDVLFMLIDYSIRSFEILERKLSIREKREVYEVFWRVGSRMGIPDLPDTFREWVEMREKHLNKDLACSDYTRDLFRQYRKHLGLTRYYLLLEAQKLVVPCKVRELLAFGKSVLLPVVYLYKLSRFFRTDKLFKNMILPAAYKHQIAALDIPPV